MEVICFVGLFALLFFLVEDLVCGRPSPVHLNEETDRLLTVSKHRKQKMEDEVICSVSLFALVCLCLEDLLLLLFISEEDGFWKHGKQNMEVNLFCEFVCSLVCSCGRPFSFSSERRDRLT